MKNNFSLSTIPLSCGYIKKLERYVETNQTQHKI